MEWFQKLQPKQGASADRKWNELLQALMNKTATSLKLYFKLFRLHNS